MLTVVFNFNYITEHGVPSRVESTFREMIPMISIDVTQCYIVVTNEDYNKLYFIEFKMDNVS